MKVRLLTAGKELVLDATIPPFNMAPDVLMWGTRVFINMDASIDNRRLYREAFATAIIPEMKEE